MIKYALQCPHDHAFEGWFRDSAAFDEQAGAGDLACPVCGARDVRKAIMAPRLGKGSAVPRQVQVAQPTGPGEASAPQAKLREKLLELRRLVETQCDPVGPAFAEEARKMHYGEAEARGIYGETTPDEAEALREEGIAFAAVPWISRGDA
jgi:hypothetical protein